MVHSRTKQLWDLFIEAECGSYEKSAWCDIFLSQVLSELHQGRTIQEILNFGNSNGIGTLIGCEILSDVHQVVSLPGDGEELEPLRSYLLNKGWRGLAVLLAMGQLNLACSSELAHLLLFLYPLCLKNQKTTEKSANAYLKLTRAVVGDITLPKSPLKSKMGGSHGAPSPRVEFHRSFSHSSARSKRGIARTGDVSPEPDSNPSSDEPGTAGCALQIGGGLFKLDPMDFDYFTSVVRSDDETRLDTVLYEPLRKPSRVTRPHPRDLVDAATDVVMESCVSPYEFSMLSVQLLTSLARAEHTFPVCPENSYPTCTQCIKFSLENLCNLQFHSASESLTTVEAVELKVGWTQLLVLCLEKVMGCPDVTCSVILAGILPMMLRVLEDVVCKINLEANKEVSLRLEEVAYGLVCGSVGFLHSLLLQGSDPDSLRTFLEMVKHMLESGGGRLLDRSVSALRFRSRRVIEMLAQLVTMVKRLRWRLHCPSARKPSRRKHRSFTDAHHHYDAFGSVASSSPLSAQHICCVSGLAMVFVRLLQNSDILPTEIVNFILRVMTSSGTCCCMPVKVAVKALLKIVKEGHSKSRTLAFALFEKTIYPQLGAYKSSGTRAPCIVCTETNTATSATWEKLELFRDLIVKSEGRQGHSIICHLVRIAPLFRDPVKEVVLFKIFFPAFVECKEVYLREKSDGAEFVILSALSVFSSLLSDATVQHFLALRGVSHILDLIYLPCFSKHCCSVLEKTIVCEWNLSAELAAVTSLGMLQTAADTATCAFLTGAGADAGRKRAMGLKRGRKVEIPEGGCATELVQSVAVFWRSYACLALSNPALRSHFAQTSILEDCGVVLNVGLGYLTKTVQGGVLGGVENDESVNHYLSKLVESLLTFLLVTSTPDSDVEDKTVLKLATAMSACDVRKVDIKKICEVVIKCSLARPSSSLVLETPKIPTMPIWSNWAEEPKDVNGASESECSGEDDYVTADEGYDADVELRTNLYFGNDTYSVESESSGHPDMIGEKSSPTIVYPKLCKLVVDLVVRAFNQETEKKPKTRESWNVKAFFGKGRDFEESLVAVLLRLGALCHDSPTNCVALCRQSVIMSLLRGFSSCLGSSESPLPNLRTVVLDLVMDLAKNAITTEELNMYLQFFKGDCPPVGELLKPLISLVSEPAPRPNFILAFPVLSPPELESQVEKSIHRIHRRDGILSCWSCAALSLVIPGSFGWSPWLTGCSISMWLRVDRGPLHFRTTPTTRKVSVCPGQFEPTRKASLCPPQPVRKASIADSHLSVGSTGFSDWGLSVEEEAASPPMSCKQVPLKKQLHVFSLGSESLAMECWVDLLSTTMTLRLTRVDATRGYEVVSEQCVESGLVSGTWHHIAFNVKDFVHLKKTVVEVIWIIDGHKEMKLQLPFVGLVMRKPRDAHLLVGHQCAEPDARTSLCLASVMLFRAPCFTRARALGLTALGPSAGNLTDCRVGKPCLNISPHVSAELVTSGAGVDWESHMEDASGGLRELAEALLLAYSTHDPTTVCLYQGGSSTGTSSLLFRPTVAEPCAAQLPPIASLPTILAPLNCKKNETILPATILLGGSSIFLYLFARVVELKGSGAEQGDALCLLLRLVQADASLYSDFITYEYYKLLRKVFLSRHCEVGLYLLKAILDACCDKPVIVETVNGLIVNSQSNAIIKNSVLLSALAGIWLDAATSSSVLLALFTALQSLLRDEHPHREFNVAQLNRVRIMTALLNFCKERLGSEEKAAVGREAWLAVVELVRSLMGAPPEFSHVVAVMDTLLLLHPANTTYITHLKNSFYLLLSAGQNYMSQTAQHDPQALRTLRQVTSMSLDKWVQVLKTTSHAKDEYTNPVDPGKLSKALTNLQLKHASGIVDTSPSPGTEDSNRFSDDVTLDSGISDTCRENTEQENNIVKAVDGSQQNLGSFFPSIVTTTCEEKGDNEEVEKYTKDVLEKEGGNCVVTEGLLLLLRDVLLVLPDNMAHQVLSYVTKFEILLVMANHENHSVRSAVVQLISSYLKRASDEERSKFMRMRGFYHLANQIALYPASLPLAEACLNLVTPCLVSLDDQNFVAQMELTGAELATLPPLLALLPRSVHDTLLTHHLINVLRTIFCKSGACARALLDLGLTEVLVKSLLASAHISSVSDHITSQDIIVADLQSFFTVIATHFLNAPGISNMQVVCDMRLELQYVSRVEQDSCGVSARCVRVIRDTQCRLLERCLDALMEKVLALQTDQRSLATFMALGIPPPEEVFGPRSMTSSHSSVSMSNVVAQPGAKEVSKSELRERVSIIIPNCTQFLIHEAAVEGDNLVLGQAESDFIHHLFPLLLQMMAIILEKRSYGRRSGASAVLWAVREPLKSEAAELLVWLMCPRQSLQTRMFAVTSLLASAKSKDIVTSFLQTHPQVEQKFTVFLWDLMYSSKPGGAELRACMELKESLQQWGVLSPHAVGNSHDSWGEECSMLLTQMDRQRGAWEKQMESAIIRCVTKYDGLVKAMSEDAMVMTRVAVDAQNVERKALMSEIRQAVSAGVAATARWRSVVDQLTHERALWCEPRSLPQFWQLDSTEGPHRVRVRLAPTHLSLAPRYLKPDHRYKLNAAERPQPLSYLFERHRETCPSAVVIERLHCNEKIRAMAAAHVVTPSHEVAGELLLGESSIYFVADDKHLCSTLEAGSTAWPFEDVREVHHRRFQLQERAIELFLRTGRTYLIAFQTCKEKDEFAAALSECELPNQANADTLVHYTNLWRERHITNWEYLTQLNKIAGRSFNDLMQYPVFPFILADYASQKLDLTDPGSFRNLKRPMAVQDKQNEQHYINNYNELLSGLKQVSLNREPYHYGSHYSNSGTVLHFLVRLPPFTTMLLQYQDRNFDLPDRTFHSMGTTWRLTSCDSTTDVKEMLPEFFYLPEFLVNFQGFDFGIRQNGARVDDVDLPPWSGGDPRRFVLIHRQALESDEVTENLPHWIDLVFGYKQTGKAAVDAINVFHPATYCGFDVESIHDPLERIAWETMVRTYGQTPRQLLRTPHPLVVQSLVPMLSPARPVLKDVRGLKWGSYVGSPMEPEPRIAWKQTSKDGTVASSLLPLSTNDVYALPAATTCLVRYTKEKGLSLVNSTTIRAALVTWGHPDGILRVKVKKELQAEPLLFISHLNPVTACCSVPESGQLWIGHQFGSVSVVKFAFRQDRYHVDFASLPLRLQAHHAAVTAIALSRAFSIAITASRDGTLIIWDLNSVSYVRNIDLDEPIVLVAVSSTLGDIASVVQTSEPAVSRLNVHSINAALLGRVTIHDGPVTSLCFSSAMEGVSVNVVACGLANGIIRLWSTWDLSHIRDIQNPAFQFPIISLMYSHDSQHLYAGCADGTVVVWEGSGVKYDSNPPKFLNLKSLL